MSENCALCGEPDPEWDLRPCREWTNYLREERDLGWAKTRWLVPLCSDCFGDVDALHDTFKRREQVSESRQEQVVADAHAELDKLDLDSLVVEEIQ
ncbi:hypothetical protein [Haloarcula sp. Atlit-47R]|uniref:hypothetical protein n=1 Tax=Haloarcula sp. Atlit-47R TaxID=2282132 RepID=UPI0011C41EBE|nr:hypothetical protein [Haloarcula sp. Atlit-47R]